MYTITSGRFSSGLPNKVKVGPVEYQVIMATSPKAPGKNEGEEVPVYGMVNFKRSEITIDEELTPMMQWQCLWHELFHIIFEQLGLSNDDEGGTDALAYKILEILTDNGFLLGSTDPQFPAQETPVICAYTPYEASLAHGE